MSRVEKASEPSMEDILSSIRKIIAEDPTGAKTPAAAIPPMAAKPAVKVSVPAAKSTPSSLDDILGLADDGGSFGGGKSLPPVTAKTEATVAPPAPALDQRPPQPAERAPIQPFFPPQSRDPLPSSRSMPVAFAPLPGEPPKSDLGAFVPGRSDGGLMERINGSASSAMRSPVAAPAPAPAPSAAFEALTAPAKAETAAAKPVEPKPASVTATEKPAMMTTAAPAAVPHAAPAQAAAAALAMAAAKPAERPEIAPVAPKAMESAPAVAAKSAFQEPKSEPPKTEAVTAEPVKADAPKVEPAKAEPMKAEAAKPAPIETAPAAPPVSPIVPPPQRRVVTVDSTIPGTAVTVTPKPAATAPVVAQSAMPPAAEPVRSMEDTVAELLRPMLRQWLDQNMPRVVEKALRVELAASAQAAAPVVTQAKNDPAKH